ncbi:uncharacterized protein A4U43_C08F3460 [Asparagus officinalis]|nr:uncharacterized protein A4U43_C08F3460 [Asparagus officinalis]
MSDSAEMLRKASQQLRHMGRARRPSFALRLNNVQTWLSAAITDQSMCLLSLQMHEEDQKSTAGSRMHLVTRKKVMETNILEEATIGKKCQLEVTKLRNVIGPISNIFVENIRNQSRTADKNAKRI